jgi:anti-anti-sigma regulatory factor
MSPSSRATARVAKPTPPDATLDQGPAEPATVTLPERMDFNAARDLHARLAELRGSPVSVDGTAVVFGGALAAQILLAAALDWSAAGDTLLLTVSPTLRDDLQRLDVLGRFPTLIEVE